MTVCDICGAPKADFNATAIVDNSGMPKDLELCGRCYREFRYREDRARCQVYEETILVREGKIPHKSHWWDIFSW